MSSRAFESLRVWHESRRLTARIYQITHSGPFARDFAFRDQIRRAALSVMSNIAEGCEGGGRRHFAHFLTIAKGSAAEVRSQLYAAEDVEYLDARASSEVRAEFLSLSRQIAALIAQLGNLCTGSRG
jgi:four helix bundle protein